MKKWWALIKKSAIAWSDDNAPRLGAALAYYTTFSVAPLIIVIVAVTGLIFGAEAVRGQISDQLQGLVGSESAETIESMIEGANKPRTGIIATVIGIATILLGATGVFVELQAALDAIWNVQPKSAGIWMMIRYRLLSFAMILSLGFLLLVSLVMSAALSAAGSYLSGILPLPEFVMQIINLLFSLFVITLLFAMMFKILPDAKIQWKDVWMGAFVTALLFTVGKSLIGLYIGKAGVASTYGAAGSIAVFLIWVYYSAQILLYGAEFTKVYANNYGSKIVPKPNAVMVEDTGGPPPQVTPPAEQGKRKDRPPARSQRQSDDAAGARETIP